MFTRTRRILIFNCFRNKI